MNRALIAVAMLVVMGCWQPVLGQFAERNRIGRFSGGRFLSGHTARSSILNSPSVSPYLALTDLNGSGITDPSRNYFTVVRPQLENQQRQQRQQQSISHLQRNVASINSNVARANQQQGVRGTGHPTRFATYLQYYPGLSR